MITGRQLSEEEREEQESIEEAEDLRRSQEAFAMGSSIDSLRLSRQFSGTSDGASSDEEVIAPPDSG